MPENEPWYSASELSTKANQRDTGRYSQTTRWRASLRYISQAPAPSSAVCWTRGNLESYHATTISSTDAAKIHRSMPTVGGQESAYENAQYRTRRPRIPGGSAPDKNRAASSSQKGEENYSDHVTVSFFPPSFRTGIDSVLESIQSGWLQVGPGGTTLAALMMRFAFFPSFARRDESASPAQSPCECRQGKCRRFSIPPMRWTFFESELSKQGFGVSFHMRGGR